MPAPASNDELAEVILKSGVLEEPKLKAYLHKLAASESGSPADPTQLAGLLVRDGLLTYFQAEQLLQGKWKRFFIGKYKVLERLGVGGMGQVFLCEHKLMKRKVAVKVLPAAKSADEAALSRFYREARAVAALDHPNLVRAYDIDQDENLHFLVMEYVDGINLHDLVRKFGTVDVQRACHYVYGAVVGLQHAHEMGLVHRDIKPANILVDRGGVVKILDMGLARFFNPDEDDMLTKKFDESVLGTADYLAPEQAIDSSTVDIRADIYGLGGTFYYMLTGFPPFPEGSVAQKLLWHQTKPPKPIRAIRPDVPEGVAAIVERMMAKDPANRFQSPSDLMDVLAPWVQSPIAPPPDHEMPQMSLAASGSIPGRAAPGSGPAINAAVNKLPVYHTSAIKSDPVPTLSLKSSIPVLVKPIPAAPAGTVTPLPPIPAAISYSQPAAGAVVPVQPAIPAVWQSLQDTTPNRDTDRPKTKKSKSKIPTADDEESEATPKSTRPTRSNSKLPLFLVAAVVGFLFIGGTAAAVVAIWILPGTKKDYAPPAHVGHRKVYVAADGTTPDAANTRKTIREAITAARTGDTIILLDAAYESPALRLDGKGALKNIRIESGHGAPVTWTFKADPKLSSQAALEVLGVEDFALEGIVFELGGGCHAGVLLAGNCPGTTLQNVTVKNPKTMGFRFNNIAADAGHPVKMAKCRVLGTTPFDCGIDLFANPSSSNHFIFINDCRVEGPAKAGFKIEGAAANIEINNNRVHGVEIGCHFAGPFATDKPLTVKLEHNTFHSTSSAGVALDNPLAATHEILIQRNLFVNTPMLLKSANTVGIKAGDNARDAASKEGPVNIAAAATDGLNVPANKENDAEFLRPTGGKLPIVGQGTAGAE